jgi:hypothetical protein
LCSAVAVVPSRKQWDIWRGTYVTTHQRESLGCVFVSVVIYCCGCVPTNNVRIIENGELIKV